MNLQTKILNELKKMPIELQEEVFNYAQYLRSKLNNQTSLKSLTAKELEIMKKWEYLLEYDQELDTENPLDDSELEVVRQVLSRQNKTRPNVPKKEEIYIAEDFNAPLPDDIIDSFYS
jgi:hypothetical protein